MKTTLSGPGVREKKWYLLDASNRILGRVATRAATVLMGKHKATYVPFLDTGDFVIIINAAKVRLTGRKFQQRMYQSFSGYPGGRKETPLSVRLQKEPEEVVRGAVLRMLPRHTLGRQMIDKLKVYAGAEHPHSAQTPVPLVITDMKA